MATEAERDIIERIVADDDKRPLRRFKVCGVFNVVVSSGASEEIRVEMYVDASSWIIAKIRCWDRANGMYGWPNVEPAWDSEKSYVYDIENRREYR